MPVLFQPIIRDNCCYIDGGILSNYPLNACLQDTQCRDDEVLGLRNQWNNPNESINDHSSLVEYLRFINLQLVRMVNRIPADRCIPNEVVCHVKPGITPAEWFSIMSDADQRLAWIADGVAFANQFLAERTDNENNATNATNPIADNATE